MYRLTAQIRNQKPSFDAVFGWHRFTFLQLSKEGIGFCRFFGVAEIETNDHPRSSHLLPRLLLYFIARPMALKPMSMQPHRRLLCIRVTIGSRK